MPDRRKKFEAVEGRSETVARGIDAYDNLENVERNLGQFQEGLQNDLRGELSEEDRATKQEQLQRIERYLERLSSVKENLDNGLTFLVDNENNPLLNETINPSRSVAANRQGALRNNILRNTRAVQDATNNFNMINNQITRDDVLSSLLADIDLTDRIEPDSTRNVEQPDVEDKIEEEPEPQNGNSTTEDRESDERPQREEPSVNDQIRSLEEQLNAAARRRTEYRSAGYTEGIAREDSEMTRLAEEIARLGRTQSRRAESRERSDEGRADQDNRTSSLRAPSSDEYEALMVEFAENFAGYEPGDENCERRLLDQGIDPAKFAEEYNRRQERAANNKNAEQSKTRRASSYPNLRAPTADEYEALMEEFVENFAGYEPGDDSCERRLLDQGIDPAKFEEEYNKRQERAEKNKNKESRKAKRRASSYPNLRAPTEDEYKALMEEFAEDFVGYEPGDDSCERRLLDQRIDPAKFEEMYAEKNGIELEDKKSEEKAEEKKSEDKKSGEKAEEKKSEDKKSEEKSEEKKSEDKKSEEKAEEKKSEDKKSEEEPEEKKSEDKESEKKADSQSILIKVAYDKQKYEITTNKNIGVLTRFKEAEVKSNRKRVKIMKNDEIISRMLESHPEITTKVLKKADPTLLKSIAKVNENLAVAYLTQLDKGASADKEALKTLVEINGRVIGGVEISQISYNVKADDPNYGFMKKMARNHKHIAEVKIPSIFDRIKNLFGRKQKSLEGKEPPKELDKPVDKEAEKQPEEKKEVAKGIELSEEMKKEFREGAKNYRDKLREEEKEFRMSLSPTYKAAYDAMTESEKKRFRYADPSEKVKIMNELVEKEYAEERKSESSETILEDDPFEALIKVMEEQLRKEKEEKEKAKQNRTSMSPEEFMATLSDEEKEIYRSLETYEEKMAFAEAEPEERYKFAQKAEIEHDVGSEEIKAKTPEEEFRNALSPTDRAFYDIMTDDEKKEYRDTDSSIRADLITPEIVQRFYKRKDEERRKKFSESIHVDEETMRKNKEALDKAKEEEKSKDVPESPEKSESGLDLDK